MDWKRRGINSICWSAVKRMKPILIYIIEKFWMKMNIQWDVVYKKVNEHSPKQKENTGLTSWIFPTNFALELEFPDGLSPAYWCVWILRVPSEKTSAWRHRKIIRRTRWSLFYTDSTSTSAESVTLIMGSNADAFSFTFFLKSSVWTSILRISIGRNIWINSWNW